MTSDERRRKSLMRPCRCRCGCTDETLYGLCSSCVGGDHLAARRKRAARTSGWSEAEKRAAWGDR